MLSGQAEQDDENIRSLQGNRNNHLKNDAKREREMK
jgi:hypothetical protein